MDLEVQRHEQEHERLLADLEKLEKLTEVAVQVSVLLSSDVRMLLVVSVDQTITYMRNTCVVHVNQILCMACLLG